MAKLDDPELLKDLYINQRLDTGVIAEQLGVGFNTVVRAFTKFNIKKEDRFPKVFTAEQSSVLYGSLLGDANLCIQPNGINACLRMEHSLAQSDWLKWKFERFRPWINADKPSFSLNKKKKGSDKTYSSIKFTTVATPLFTDVFYQFYPNKEKIVTKTVLDKVDALALAVWFQDDGSYTSTYKGKGSGVMKMHTNGFTFMEQEMICAYFNKKWNINPRINTEKWSKKQYHYLSFGKDDQASLIEIIRPYVIPSLTYKLDPNLKANVE